MEEQKIEVKEIQQKVKNENQLLIEELAEEFFPGNWDLGPIEINLLNRARGNNSLDHLDNIQRLIISFPEVEIVNEDGGSHTIHDFHIALLFTNDFSNVASSSTYSFRSTTTPKELYNGYVHSHSSVSSSSPSDYFTWRYMCLGGESELTDLMGRLLLEGVSRKLLFETFLMFSVYVGWESLDGGPYLQMSDLENEEEDYEDPNLFEMPDDVISEYMESLADGTNTLPQIYGSSCVNATSFVAGITEILREKAAEDIEYLYYLGEGDDYNWVNCLNTREVDISIDNLISLNNNIHHNIDIKGRNIELRVIDDNLRIIRPEDINVNNYHPSYKAMTIILNDYIKEINKFKNKKIYESLKN